MYAMEELEVALEFKEGRWFVSELILFGGFDLQDRLATYINK